MPINHNIQLKILAELYPKAHCELFFNNAFELLIATILSAQATDKQVNKLTVGLFDRCPSPKAFIALGEEKISQLIKGLGLFRVKAQYIIKTCQILVTEHGGQVPTERSWLEKLPGVGRKTAGVVLYNAFGIPAIPVDTHVHRVANRLQLATSKDPLKTEEQLMAKIPPAEWGPLHHQLIWHGRRICIARKPKCAECPLAPYCPATTIEPSKEK